MSRDRVSLYVRLSRAADEENLSLSGMTAELRDFVSKLGLREVACHVDDGLSGGYRDRAEFRAWLDDARKGRADVLATPHVDRLTREGLNVAASVLDVVEGKDPSSGRPSHRPVRLLDMYGIDSEHGDAFRMRFVIQAEVGRSERERIKQRTHKSVRRIRAAGRWPGGIPPFGYRAVPNPDGAGVVLEPDPKEAAALRECAQRVLAGQSLGQVCRWLNTQDVTPRIATEFRRQSLQVALTSAAATGRITSEGKVLPGVAFAPVLSDAESAALKAILKPGPGGQWRGGRQPSRLLSGLLRCYGCDAVLHVWKRAEGKLAYRCPSRGQGKSCPTMITVQCAPVEAYVTEEVLKLIGDKPMTRQETVVIHAGDMETIEREIQDTVMEITHNATMELVKRLQSLQQARDVLMSVVPQMETRTVDLGMTGREWWEAAILDDRRDLIGNIWPRLVLLPSRRGVGFVPARLVMQHGEPDYAYEAWLQEQ